MIFIVGDVSYLAIGIFVILCVVIIHSTVNDELIHQTLLKDNTEFLYHRQNRKFIGNIVVIIHDVFVVLKYIRPIS